MSTAPVPHQEDMSRLRQLTMGFRISQMIHVAANLGLADHLARKPRNTRRSSQQLASRWCGRFPPVRRSA